MPNLNLVIIPVIVFLLILIGLFWLRRFAYHSLKSWFGRIRWEGGNILLQALRIPSILWALIISIYLGLVASSITPVWKDLSSKGLWSLFIISVTVAAVNAFSSLIIFYGRRQLIPLQAARVLRNVGGIIFLIVGVLAILEVWGVPTSPILLLIAILALAGALIFRDAAPNFFAGLQISATKQIKLGDYIKLSSGEEGYVIAIRWNNTYIQALNGSTIVPNSRLLQSTVINYGRPLRKAKEPFRFYSREHLKELTGLKAKNLQELTDTLRTAPEAMIYYHTHHFLEEQHYLTPEPSNDFAVWVTDSLGDEVLGERLASIDTFEFATLASLKDRILSVIEEYLTQRPGSREAMPGREFYFMKSVSVIMPTPYEVHDLREFVEALRKISLESL